ncbi:hypothetical protein ES703_79544 [subsurface metagenome]
MEDNIIKLAFIFFIVMIALAAGLSVLILTLIF